MKKNIGSADRIIRFVVGAGILLIGLLNQSWWALVGIIPILTATINWCPLYLPCGINTCSTEKK